MEELVLNKIQDILGDDYELNLGNAFDRRYTIPINTPNGLAQDINFQAFDEKKDKVICVFTMQPAEYNVVPFVSYNTSYTLQLWYTLDSFKADKFGVPLGSLPTDIYADLETLRTTLSNTTITLSTTLKAKMTFSKPAKSTVYDKTGVGKRAVLTVNGKINITDKGIFGSDRVIKIGITTGETTTYYAMHKRSYNISNIREGVSTQVTRSVRPVISGQSNGNSVTFSYDNYTNSTNLAMALIEKIACGETTTDSKFTVPVQIYKGTSLVSSYNALISASIVGVNGETGTETIEVTLERA